MKFLSCLLLFVENEFQLAIRAPERARRLHWQHTHTHYWVCVLGSAVLVGLWQMEGHGRVFAIMRLNKKKNKNEDERSRTQKSYTPAQDLDNGAL